MGGLRAGFLAVFMFMRLYLYAPRIIAEASCLKNEKTRRIGPPPAPPLLRRRRLSYIPRRVGCWPAFQRPGILLAPRGWRPNLARKSTGPPWTLGA